MPLITFELCFDQENGESSIKDSYDDYGHFIM